MCLACIAGSAPHAGEPSPFPLESAPIPWPDGRSAGGTMRWTGVAGFCFELDGTRIAFDPFVSRPGALAVMLRSPRVHKEAVAARFSDLDAVFVGHTHYDHSMDVPAVSIVSPRATIHGSRTTAELMRRLDVEPTRLVEVEDGARYEVGPFVVTAIASDHGLVPIVHHFDRIELAETGVPRTPFRYPRGAVFAWRIEAGGRTFHVQGSAGIDDAALERQAPCDALIACLAARRDTPRYLERLGAVLRPGVLMPCHHDHFMRPLSKAPRPVPGLDWPAFLADAEALDAAWQTRLHLPPLDRPIPW